MKKSFITVSPDSGQNDNVLNQLTKNTKPNPLEINI